MVITFDILEMVFSECLKQPLPIQNSQRKSVVADKSHKTINNRKYEGKLYVHLDGCSLEVYADYEIAYEREYDYDELPMGDLNEYLDKMIEHAAVLKGDKI